MVIRVLPNQIPMVWEQVKFVAAKTDRVSNGNMAAYLNRLLVDLLNDKAQCFIRMDEDRQLLALAITKFSKNELTGEKDLSFSNLYSFKNVGVATWQNEIEFLKDFARQTGCKRIVFNSSNERVFEIAIASGFREAYRCFVVEV